MNRQISLENYVYKHKLDEERRKYMNEISVPATTSLNPSFENNAIRFFQSHSGIAGHRSSHSVEFG